MLIADGIGEVTFKIGNGVIIFFPVFYAIILGIMLGPQVLKIIRLSKLRLPENLF